MNSSYDIVVSGGGLVGLTMALALGQDGFNVALLESGAFPSSPPESSGLRVSALARASESLLDELGVWSTIPDTARQPYSRMRVWDASVPAYSERALEFCGTDLGELNLGHIVENDGLRFGLTKALHNCKAVTLFEHFKLTSIEREGRALVLSDADGVEVVAELLIGADGARSFVRESLSIELFRKSYEQRGVVAYVESEEPHNDTAWQRFLPEGPLALLPCSGQRSSIVWSTNQKHADQLLIMPDEEFNRELTEATDAVLGKTRVVSQRASFPLNLQYAKRYTASQAVLIGDAAHVVHPLAGQGVNMGFADVVCLRAALQGANQRNDMLSDARHLRAYERERKAENRAMLSALDAIHHLFISNSPMVESVRTVGMGLIDRSAWLKKLFVREAMGV